MKVTSKFEGEYANSNKQDSQSTCKQISGNSDSQSSEIKQNENISGTQLSVEAGSHSCSDNDISDAAESGKCSETNNNVAKDSEQVKAVSPEKNDDCEIGSLQENLKPPVHNGISSDEDFRRPKDTLVYHLKYDA